jgi:hypothetical protein
MGIDLNALEEDARLRAQVPGAAGNTVTVTGNPITINITTPPGADPKTIGDAAGRCPESAAGNHGRHAGSAVRDQHMKSFKTTTIAGTITAGGTSQQIAERNPKRDLLILQNPAGETGQLFYNFGADAEVGGVNLGLAPGESVRFDQHCGVPGESIHVTASDADHAFVLLLGQQANVE